MIRKNAVESILAERNILISARNPFVVSISYKIRPASCVLILTWKGILDLSFCCYKQVRFYYSFTSRENLYLVMEYLNGGDLYSLLRNLGCLAEDVARLYIAEVVSTKLWWKIVGSCIHHRERLLFIYLNLVFNLCRFLHWNTCIHWMSFIGILNQTIY